MILNIEQPGDRPHPFALFQLGFRPFFLGAALYAVVSVTLWTLIYSFQWWPENLGAWRSPFWWHGHEMVYGYSVAVVTGFLLTATKNWTGVQTLRFTPLALLFTCWLLARLLPWIPGVPLLASATVELLFLIGATVAITHPLYQARQWDQVRIFTSKLTLLTLSNLLFYLGLLDLLPGGERIGLYGGVYLILALVLTLGRRVFPFFIEKGVQSGGGLSPITLRNSRFLDLASLVLFLLFVLTDLILTPGHLTWEGLSATAVVASLAMAQVVVHLLRFRNWYTSEVWSRPLLWVLLVGYGWIIFGFLLVALSVWLPIPSVAALHAFTYGAIATITLGMMARVTLGHTGRNVLSPPTGLRLLFGLITVGAVVRVVLPLLLPTLSSHWVLLSQLLWIVAFLHFLSLHAFPLLRPRVDGRPG